MLIFGGLTFINWKTQKAQVLKIYMYLEDKLAGLLDEQKEPLKAPDGQLSIFPSR